MEESTTEKMILLDEKIEKVSVHNEIKVTGNTPIHFVYGYARRKPLFMPYNERHGSVSSVLQKFAKSPTDLQKTKSRTWYLLYYPMHEAEFEDGSKKYFMRCKSVVRETWQLGWHLVVVYESLPDGNEIRTFSSFNTFPS